MRAAAIIQGAHLPLVLAILALVTAVDFGRTGALAAEPRAPAKSATSPFAKGPIEKLDPAHGQLTIKTEDGLRTFVLAPGTYLYQGQEKITADKLATGETVAVRFIVTPGGSNLVIRLKAYPAPPAGPPPQKETP